MQVSGRTMRALGWRGLLLGGLILLFASAASYRRNQTPGGQTQVAHGWQPDIVRPCPATVGVQAQLATPPEAPSLLPNTPAED